MTAWKSKIIGHDKLPPDQLLAHPLNWRTHPQAQRDALKAAIEEIGFIRSVTVNKRTGNLIDGHERCWAALVSEQPTIDVEYVDLSEEAELKALATMDPIGELATINAENLDALLREVETGSEALQQMLADLAEEAGLYQGNGEGGDGTDTTYTNKIVAPIYEPKGEKPPLSALIDRGKTLELIEGIEASELPDDVKEFMIFAAERHTVFNFRQIAEFYCHADAELQDLMERSGLVIIDFDKAIEYGFVHLTERLGALADLEEADA